MKMITCFSKLFLLVFIGFRSNCSNLHMKTGDLTTQINELQRIVSVENVGGGGKDSISRQEVNSIINLQNQLTSGMEEVK